MATAKKAVAKKTPGTSLVRSSEEQKAMDRVTGGDLLLSDAQQSQGTFGQDDLALPFLRVLQKGSPQVNKRDDLYIEGAEPGMFINVATGEVFEGEETGVLVVPVHYTPSYIEWKLRKNGGGFVRDYGADSSIMKQTSRENEDGLDLLPNGNQVVRSGMYYLKQLRENGQEPDDVVLTLSGTQLKKSRKWNTLMTTQRIPHPNGGTFVPAPFYFTYRIRTVYEENEKGDWFGVSITREQPLIEMPKGALIYLAAREFKQHITAGKVSVRHDTVDAEVIEGEAEDGDETF